jgi:hypothetical protein
MDLAANNSADFDSIRAMQDFIEMSGDGQPITDTGAFQDSVLLAISTAKIGTFDWDIATQQVSWNDYRALLGDPAPVKVTYYHWENRGHPDDRLQEIDCSDRARDESRDWVSQWQRH